jgi:hypothetical protein
MHYLTQHYKNRCTKLQEQVDALSYYLVRLNEASGMMTAAPSGPAANQYSGEGLSQLLAGFFAPGADPRAAQNAVNAYVSAWQAQASGGGDIGVEAPASYRSSTAGRSVANAARGIMSAADTNAASVGRNRPMAGSSRDMVNSAPVANYAVGGPAGGPGPGSPFQVGGEIETAGGYGGQAGGIPGDYNGDGRVDGADLGIALGNYGQPGYNFQTTLQNWTGAGSSPTSSASVRGGTRRRR